MTGPTPSRPASAGPGRVLVVGNCSVDIAYRVSRVPLAGETLIAHGRSQDAGGKGANQAVAAARCGVVALLAGAVGRDEPGRWLRARLADEGLVLDGLREVDLPTDESVIWVTPDGENRIVSTDAAACSLALSDVGPSVTAMAPGDVLLMQGNLGLDLTGAVLDAARAHGLVTVLNVAPVVDGVAALLPVVDHAILNAVEAEQLTGSADPHAAGRAIRARGPGHVVVTLGPGGALAIGADDVGWVAAEPVDAVDTTGAGDVFCGVYAACLVAGRPVDSALRLAVAAATVSVTRPGTQSAFPTRAAIEALTSRLELT